MRKKLLLLTLLACLVLCFPVLAESKNTPTEKDDYGLTSLHHAVAKGDIEVVKSLLKEGASIDSRDNAGRTPLHYAAGAGRGSKISYGKPNACIGMLLDNAADINPQDKLGLTPLHYASRLADLLTVRLLLK